MLPRDLFFHIGQKVDMPSLQVLMQVSSIHKNIIDDEYFWKKRVLAAVKCNAGGAENKCPTLEKALSNYGSYRELYRAVNIGYIFIHHPKVLISHNQIVIQTRLNADIEKIYDHDDLATFFYYLSLRGYIIKSILEKLDGMFDFIIVSLSIKTYKIFAYIVSEYRKLKTVDHKFPLYFYQSINMFISELLARNLEHEDIIKFLELYYSIVDTGGDDVVVVIPYYDAINELIAEQINAPLFKFFAKRGPKLIRQIYLKKAKELEYIRKNIDLSADESTV